MLLLDHGVELNAVNNNKETPVMKAVAGGHVSCR